MRLWLTDIDAYLHCNNGRYLTLCDFARVDYSLRTNVGKVCYEKGWVPLVASATVTFHRELKPLRMFNIRTRVAGHDGRKFVFLEHIFEQGNKEMAHVVVKAIWKEKRRTVRPEELLEALIRSRGEEFTGLPKITASPRAQAYIDMQNGPIFSGGKPAPMQTVQRRPVSVFRAISRGVFGRRRRSSGRKSSSDGDSSPKSGTDVSSRPPTSEEGTASKQTQ